MDYSDKQLKEIENLAAELTPPSEISVHLDINEDEFLLDIGMHNHAARKAYLKGIASTARELREKNLQLARACAPTAMEQCFKDLQEMMMGL
ncbi:MAG: hypothetical protein LKF06_00730 [Prevotella sp.]|nr:hypothetical protein [Prevotella sp.]